MVKNKFTPPKKTKRLAYFVYTHPYLAVVGAIAYTVFTYFQAILTLFAGFAGSGNSSSPEAIVITIVLFLLGLIFHPYIIVRLIKTILATKDNSKYSDKTKQATRALALYVTIILCMLLLPYIGVWLFS